MAELISPDSEYAKGFENEGLGESVEEVEYETLVLVDQSEVDVPQGFNDWTITERCKYLAGTEGLTVNQISKGLGIRYQQVRAAVKGNKPASGVARCEVCGRPLRDADSVAKGIGPVCEGRHKPPSGSAIHMGEGDDEYYQGAARA